MNNPETQKSSFYATEELRGMICGLERFAIHDGPGIRTLVFFKGCPLRCRWCSSPHTQRNVPETLHNDVRCESCGLCVERCHLEAVSLSETDGIVIDREVCDACGECADFCPNQAREVTGKQVTVEELFKEVEKDSSFYRRSGGGVSVGGGEATMQAKFVTAFLQRCKKAYIHTVLETCGYVSTKNWESILEHVDLLYLDLKHMDDATHRDLTGVSNRLILENATRASELVPMILRVPVVSGHNDSEENILATAKFVRGLGENVQRIDLLPYHKLGTHRYDHLGREYDFEDVEAPDDEHMELLKDVVVSAGVEVQIGG